MIRIEAEGLRHILDHPVFDRARFREQVRQFMEALADVGIQDATYRFAEADYDGENDAIVSAEPQWMDENTLRIQATGKSVLFIEFGTGVFNPVTHPRANELGMNRGSYGLGRGRNETWTYYGEPGTNGQEVRPGVVLTRGNNANMSMYGAAQTMRDAIAETAERIFAG